MGKQERYLEGTYIAVPRCFVELERTHCLVCLTMPVSMSVCGRLCGSSYQVWLKETPNQLPSYFCPSDLVIFIKVNIC